jgi:hypothetical protein
MNELYYSSHILVLRFQITQRIFMLTIIRSLRISEVTKKFLNLRDFASPYIPSLTRNGILSDGASYIFHVIDKKRRHATYPSDHSVTSNFCIGTS